ncbi:MAG: Ig-like domain-containing protein, partial [Bacteroides sp.]
MEKRSFGILGWLMLSLSLFLLSSASVRADEYGLKIADVLVMSDNYTDLPALDPSAITVGAGGHLTYDPQQNLLSMKNVTIVAEGGKHAIFYDGKSELKVKIEGVNVLKSDFQPALYMTNSATLEGTSADKLVVESKNNMGIHINNSMFTVSNITLDVTADNHGINALWNTRVTIKNANVSITSKKTGYALYMISQLNMPGCHIVEPKDGRFDATKQTILVGNTPAKKVKIEVIRVTGVEVSPATLQLKEEEKRTLTALVKPANAVNQDVTWSTSNDKVATVTNGEVTAVGAGSADITVTTVDGHKTATCKVTVTPKPAIAFKS